MFQVQKQKLMIQTLKCSTNYNDLQCSLFYSLGLNHICFNLHIECIGINKYFVIEIQEKHQYLSVTQPIFQCNEFSPHEAPYIYQQEMFIASTIVQLSTSVAKLCLEALFLGIYSKLRYTFLEKKILLPLPLD